MVQIKGDMKELSLQNKSMRMTRALNEVVWQHMQSCLNFFCLFLALVILNYSSFPFSCISFFYITFLGNVLWKEIWCITKSVHPGQPAQPVQTYALVNFLHIMGLRLMRPQGKILKKEGPGGPPFWRKNSPVLEEWMNEWMKFYGLSTTMVILGALTKYCNALCLNRRINTQSQFWRKSSTQGRYFSYTIPLHFLPKCNSDNFRIFHLIYLNHKNPLNLPKSEIGSSHISEDHSTTVMVHP